MLVAAPEAWAGGSRARDLDDALQQLVDMPGGPPGAIVLIQRNRHLTVHTAGLAEIGKARPPRPTDYMRIASVSKAFSGATALSLVADRLLSLEDTIGERLPELPEHWYPVTLRELLNHTSGLPDYTKSAGFREAFVGSPTMAPPPQELLEFVADEPLGPRSQYNYSNSDNIVVALMVESVTGTTYEEALRRQVLRPLHLRHTSLPSGDDLPPPFIHGYQPEEPGKLEDVSEGVAWGGWAWASGGIVSSPIDVARFVRGYVGGRLYGRRVRAEQFRFIAGGNSQPRGPGENSVGLGVFRYDTRCGAVYGHTGNLPGYTQLIAATRNGRRSVTFTIGTQISDEVMPEALPALRHAQEIAICMALGKDGARAEERFGLALR
jgi:D-alanyl-D-alanine carboxypeptidase